LTKILRTTGSEETVIDCINMLTSRGAAVKTPAITALLARPVPLEVKEAVIQAADDLKVPRVREVLRRWSGSRHASLARAARRAMLPPDQRGPDDGLDLWP
jgi:hypothetical protein